MSNLNKIREILDPIAEANGVSINDLIWRQEGNQRILEIPIMKPDKTMDLEVSSMMSEKFIEALDGVEGLEFEYFLDVCSPGAERLLNSFDEIISEIGSYVYVKLKDPKAGLFEVYGNLVNANKDLVSLEYMNKTRKETFDVDMNNISIIRLAIKF